MVSACFLDTLGKLYIKILFLTNFKDAKISNILCHEKVNFHPLINTSTVSINTKDFLLFMKKNNKLVNIFNFDNYTIENE